MNVRRTKCLLCQAPLEPTDLGYQLHPVVDDCFVRLTDEWGVTLSDEQVRIIETLDPHQRETVVTTTAEVEGLLLQQYPTADEALKTVFDKMKLPRLGGVSSGRGWSSYSLWQRCAYAWKKRYCDNQHPQELGFYIESESLAIGSYLHSFLALHYANMMESIYAGFTPDELNDQLIGISNPSFVNEAWRVFKAYRVYYSHEEVVPLAIEHDLKDPRTGDSCRFDTIVYFPKDTPGLLAGTYNLEHKSASRFDMNTLEGWMNDGEVLGQTSLWKRLGMDKRFGPLRGNIVNILGKQKEPKFHRTIVAPSSWQTESHLDDLKRFDAAIGVSIATNNFPRSRANCINRFGRCSWWDHCVTGE